MDPIVTNLNQLSTIQDSVLPHQTNSVLITDGLNHLGPYLISDLMLHSNYTLLCMAHGTSMFHSMQQIIDKLSALNLWHPSFKERIFAINGNCALPQMGLSNDQYESISQSIDAIYHCAESSSYSAVYSEIKALNMDSTIEVIRLATAKRLKPIHFISSLSVFYSKEYLNSPQKIFEDQFPSQSVPFSGYAQTKCLAENYLKTAKEEGVPVSIYRVKAQSPESIYGFFQEECFVVQLIKAICETGLSTQLDFAIPILPIDFISKAIVFLSTQDNSLNKNFHLNQDHPIMLSELTEFLKSLSYEITTVPHEDWINMISKAAPESSFMPLIAYFTQKWGDLDFKETIKKAETLIFDSTNTTQLIPLQEPLFPPTNTRLLKSYLEHMIIDAAITAPKSAKLIMSNEVSFKVFTRTETEVPEAK